MTRLHKKTLTTGGESLLKSRPGPCPRARFVETGSDDHAAGPRPRGRDGTRMLQDIELDRQVLGLNTPWTVMRVDLKVKEQWVNDFPYLDPAH